MIVIVCFSTCSTIAEHKTYEWLSNIHPNQTYLYNQWNVRKIRYPVSILISTNHIFDVWSTRYTQFDSVQVTTTQWFTSHDRMFVIDDILNSFIIMQAFFLLMIIVSNSWYTSFHIWSIFIIFSMVSRLFTENRLLKMYACAPIRHYRQIIVICYVSSFKVVCVCVRVLLRQRSTSILSCCMLSVKY
jgi:hypothetical protein